MWKWIVGALLVAGIGYVTYDVYLSHRAGLFDLPELDSNSYVITFKNGMRAIVVDPEVSVKAEGDPRASFPRLTLTENISDFRMRSRHGSKTLGRIATHPRMRNAQGSKMS